MCRIIFLACVGVVSGQRRTLTHLAQHASWNQFRVSTKQMSQHSIRDKCHSCQPSRFQVDGYKREAAGGLILGMQQCHISSRCPILELCVAVCEVWLIDEVKMYQYVQDEQSPLTPQS